MKDLSSQLSTVVSEKKDLENEVARLQEQVQTLEESKEWELAGIDDSLKKVFLDVIGMLEKELLINNQEQQLQGKKVDLEDKLKILTQQLLNNQEQQNLEKELKNVDKRLEDIDGETKKSQGQTKAHKPDTVSTVSTAKSTTGSSKSTLSKLQNLTNKLLGDKNLNNFLSRKNEELKKDFPEFKEKHFCHNVLNETIKSLSNQDDGKFESSKLLELLESNLKQSAKEIIEAKVKKVVEEGVNKIVDSILHSFNSKNNNNNDSGELLKEIVVKELVEARMRFFSDKIQELQLASSIRDKLLSPDQRMCNQTQGGVNEYQLTEKAKKDHIPNSSMSHINIASIHPSTRQKIVKVGS